MRRVLWVAVLVVLVGCGANKAATASAGTAAASSTVVVAAENGYRANVDASARNLIQTSSDLADATLAFVDARQHQYAFPQAAFDVAIGRIDALRTSNDELTKWVGRVPSPSFASVDTENKRITDRTDAFLRQYRQALYDLDSGNMVRLDTDHLQDVKQYVTNMKAAGFLQNR